ncbi:hypothetical protein [Aliikangiella maris]|uniref:HDOD domain-containing protein n=2 Tax=Aliikangiella maris TaxID=3162458 RepID=A0ABV3MLF2_9GAMM
MSNNAVLIKQRLTEYQKAPLYPLELPAIKNKLADPNSSTDSFKDIYYKDPLFCAALITAGWEATQNRSNHPYAADHALSTIGIGGAQQRFLPLKPQGEIKLSQEVQFLLSCSLLAAELAEQIGELTNASNQRYWTALFYSLPDIILWYLKPESMWRIYYRRLNRPSKLNLFEESKLGFNLHDWRKTIAEELHLSEQCQLIFSKELPTNPKELYAYAHQGISESTPSLKQWHRQEAWLIVMCNQLARAVMSCWHPHGTQHIIELIKHLSHLENRKLKQSIHQGIRNVSENLIQSPLPNPGFGYLLKPSKPPFPDWLVNPQIDKSRVSPARSTRQKTHLSGTAPTHSQSTNFNLVQLKNKVEQLISQMLNQANSFASSTALVQAGLTCLINDLPFDRASFLIVNYKNLNAQTKIALSREKQLKIKPDFNFKTTPALANFIEKQAFMCFKHEKHQKIWRQLPEAITRQKIEQFGFCSLKPGSKVRALIYFDGNNRLCFQPEILKLVKKLFLAINKGLSIRNDTRQNKTT